MTNSKVKNNVPTVSVITITYNHEKYIATCLDSLIKQKTKFNFEVIVADDHSSDKTPDIIKSYSAKFPQIIKPILRSKNLGIQRNCNDAFRTAKGKYIAFCEGDDYWTDPKKLQLQADFLDKHSNYALCFHPVEVFFENNEAKNYTYPDSSLRSKFTQKELLRRNFIQSNSVMYKRRPYDNLPDSVMPLDWYLHLYHAQFGKIGFINKVMSAYRRHPGGVWWDTHQNLNAIWKKHGLAHLELYIELLKLYGSDPGYQEIIYKHITNLFSGLSAADNRLISKALRKFPKITEPLIIGQARQIRHLEQTLKQLTHEVGRLRQSVTELNKTSNKIKERNKHLAAELTMIKSLKTWKLRSQLIKFLGKKPV